MADREFIHSSADVASTLRYAFDSGLQVRLDDPQVEARPRILSWADIGHVDSGVLFLFRPEWVFGPFQITQISGGYNVGKYDVAPRVNCAPLTVYFQGERMSEGRRLFGSCVVSSHSEWLEMPAKVLHPTPPDVHLLFKRIVAHLSSGIVIKAGVHKYHVCKGVISDPNAAECRPPFDFIPWSKELLYPRAKRRPSGL